MERYEIGDDERFASLIEAARRGDEAVLTQHGEVVAEVSPVRRPVLLTRDGQVAKPGMDWEALKRLHEGLPSGFDGKGAEAVRELRDAGYRTPVSTPAVWRCSS